MIYLRILRIVVFALVLFVFMIGPQTMMYLLDVTPLNMWPQLIMPAAILSLLASGLLFWWPDWPDESN